MSRHRKVEDNEYGRFPCPGCGRRDEAHPPLCPIAIRLTAADAQRYGDDWRRQLLSASLFFVDLIGCRWCPVARHMREAAGDDPPADDRGEPLVWCPYDELFRPEAVA